MKRYVYLAMNVAHSTLGEGIRTRLEWQDAMSISNIGVMANYLERMQAGEPGGPEQIFRDDVREIEQYDGFLLDISKDGALYVGALIELGYAAAMGKPIVVYAPEGVNAQIYERAMVQGTATVVHSRNAAAQQMAAKLWKRA